MAYTYVSDAIGNDYMNWKSGDNIIISFPTGTGKTYFVLNVLVPYAKKLNKKIVMFCNRVALYEQINNAISEEDKEYIEKQNIFNYDALHKLIGNIDDKNATQAIWNFYMFQLWYDEYMK